jgi:hypothetical protein
MKKLWNILKNKWFLMRKHVLIEFLPIYSNGQFELSTSLRIVKSDYWSDQTSINVTILNLSVTILIGAI